MISRRTILKWLGLAPVAAAAMPGLVIGSLDTAYAPTRVRAWKVVLEPDGSSVLVKGNERWLGSWLKTQKEEDWGFTQGDGGERTYITPRLSEIEQIIEADAEAVKERCSFWENEFKEIGIRPTSQMPIPKAEDEPDWYKQYRTVRSAGA